MYACMYLPQAAESIGTSGLNDVAASSNGAEQLDHSAHVQNGSGFMCSTVPASSQDGGMGSSSRSSSVHNLPQTCLLSNSSSSANEVWLILQHVALGTFDWQTRSTFSQSRKPTGKTISATLSSMWESMGSSSSSSGTNFPQAAPSTSNGAQQLDHSAEDDVQTGFPSNFFDFAVDAGVLQNMPQAAPSTTNGAQQLDHSADDDDMQTGLPSNFFDSAVDAGVLQNLPQTAPSTSNGAQQLDHSADDDVQTGLPSSFFDFAVFAGVLQNMPQHVLLELISASSAGEGQLRYQLPPGPNKAQV